MDADDKHIGEQLRALSEPTRYKIVQFLMERHHCARSMALTLGISEAAVSQHMAVLKRVGIVNVSRHGYHMHYELNREALKNVIAAMNQWLERLDNVKTCHEPDSCKFRLDDGSRGCLYKNVTRRKGSNS